MTGFVIAKLDKKMVDERWFRNPATVKLLMYFILKVNYQDEVFEGMTIKRGQMLISTAKLAKRNQLTTQQAKTSTGNLIRAGYLTKELTTLGTLYTLVNYDFFDDHKKNVTSHVTDGFEKTNQLGNQRNANHLTTTINNKIINKNINPNAYAFCGEKIRLNAEDYGKIKTQYQHLSDLDAELRQLDLQLRDKKSWWPEMHAKLNYRNKQEKQRTGKSTLTKNRNLEDQLKNTGWAK